MLRIRAMREGDWEACLALDVSYETETAWQMDDLGSEGEWGGRFREVRLPRTQRIEPALPPEARAEEWAHSDVFWVAAEGRRIRGYLALVLEPGHGQARIVDLAVDADHRRRGVGTTLLQHAAGWCLRKGIAQLILACPLKAQPAMAFARRHHFAFCGYQEAYWPGQEVVLFFRKRLP